ncbi:hypothetical protein M0802_015436 [Mischocyttarus mexicanus]|nr:hypothetical protein M0802_015436 [Mischocyttarus mexicanus]
MTEEVAREIVILLGVSCFPDTDFDSWISRKIRFVTGSQDKQRGGTQNMPPPGISYSPDTKFVFGTSQKLDL